MPGLVFLRLQLGRRSPRIRRADEHLSRTPEDRSLEVWIGVDASVKRDSTALCICSYDGQAVRLVGHRVWQPSSEEPLDFEGTIEHELLELRHRFDIREVLYDPYTDAGFGAASQT
jgi:hypothetical protein